jgi:hypothetical protein
LDVDGHRYDIEVDFPKYCAILSPCCSIGEKVLCLSPLIKLRQKFFDNPYFVSDFTNINRVMNPQQTLPPAVWDGLLAEERIKREAKGPAYSFIELFVYQQCEWFPSYRVDRRDGQVQTNYYMIDFRNIFKVSCESVLKPDKVPIDAKLLQLTTETRSQLREKISYYFSRVPQEDVQVEA